VGDAVTPRRPRREVADRPQDTNRDGKLQPSELRIALYSYGIKTSDDEARDTFDAADADGSGGIDFGEFVDYVKSGDGDASKAFKRGLLGGPRY